MSFILLKEKCDKLGTDERCPVRRFPGWALLWGDFKRCHSQCGSGNCDVCSMVEITISVFTTDGSLHRAAQSLLLCYKTCQILIIV